MIRLLGAAAILICGALVGSLGARRLAARHIFWIDLESGLAALEREIGYVATPLPLALLHAADVAGSSAVLFEQASALLQNGDGVCGGEAWRLACAAQTDWTQQERAAALAVSSGLGESDLAGQLQGLALARQRVGLCIQQSAERSAKYGRVWRSLGWAGGASLVLLFI